MVGERPRILWQFGQGKVPNCWRKTSSTMKSWLPVPTCPHRPGVYDRRICSWYQQMPQLRCATGASRGLSPSMTV